MIVSYGLFEQKRYITSKFIFVIYRSYNKFYYFNLLILDFSFKKTT
jgi:hypothetical protein